MTPRSAATWALLKAATWALLKAATWALLKVEWSSRSDVHGMGTWIGCPVCHGQKPPGWGGPDGHKEGCDLDFALNEVGLDTAEKRDAARAEMAKQ